MLKQLITHASASAALAIALSGQIQTGASTSVAQNTPGSGASVSVHTTIPIVADVALATIDSNGSKQDQQGHYYRSSDGKVREDLPAGSVITDFKAGTITTLNPATSQAIVSSTPGPKGRYVSRTPLSTTHTMSTIGQTTVEGHPVVMTHITRSSSTVQSTEIWTATDLRLTVLTKATSQAGLVTTKKYKNINSVEPDPSLFTVPPGYTIVLNSPTSVSSTSTTQ